MLNKILFILFALPLFAVGQTKIASTEISKFLPLNDKEKLTYEIVINTKPKYTNTLTISAIDSIKKTTRHIGTFSDIEFIYYNTNTIQGLEFSDDRTMCVIRFFVGDKKGSVFTLVLVDGRAGIIRKIAEGHIFFSRMSPDGRFLVFAPDSTTSGNSLEMSIVSTQTASVLCNLVWPNDFSSIFTRVSFRRLIGTNNLLVLKDEEDHVVEVSILNLENLSLHDVTDSYMQKDKYFYMFDPIWQDLVMTERTGTIIYK